MQELDFHRAMARPGTLVDAGAHAGGFALPAAALPGIAVVAFEPLPTAFSRLVDAIRQAGLGNVAAHQVALGDADGAAVLAVPYVGGAAQEEWASIAKDYAAIQAEDPRIQAIERTIVGGDGSTATILGRSRR